MITKLTAAILVMSPAIALSQTRAPPSQITGPIKIIGPGSTGDASGLDTSLPGGVARTSAQRAADRPSPADFSTSDHSAAFTAARNAAGANGLANVLEQYAPTSAVGGADATWLLTGRGARTPLDNLAGAVVRVGRRHNTCAYPALTGGTTGGFFSSYDCTGAFSVVDRQDYGKTILNKPFIIDAAFVQSVDADTAVHPETADASNNRAITNALRALIVGPPSGPSLAKQYKDLIGLDAHAIGRIDDPLRGTSGVAVGAIQYGIGIASNEFAVQNPSPADFGLPLNSWEQSRSMAAVQAILRPHYADANASHQARAVLAGNDQGFLATAGMIIYSAAHGSVAARDGAFMHALDMKAAKVRDAAIRMPQSRAGSSGTVIEYDPNDYTDFLRDVNIFRWIVGGTVPFGITPSGVSVGSATNVPGTRMFFEPSTAATSQLRLFPGVAPTAPASGDLWFDGTNLRIQVGGVTRTITLQ